MIPYFKTKCNPFFSKNKKYFCSEIAFETILLDVHTFENALDFSRRLLYNNPARRNVILFCRINERIRRGILYPDSYPFLLLFLYLRKVRTV